MYTKPNPLCQNQPASNHEYLMSITVRVELNNAENSYQLSESCRTGETYFAEVSDKETSKSLYTPQQPQ